MNDELRPVQPARGPHGGNMTTTWDEEDRGSLAPAPARCPLHPAFDDDYCPACGTARPVGMTTEQAIAWALDNK